MSRYITDALAKLVASRAGNRCEYCRILIDDTYFGGEIDHIRSLKHNGTTDPENLALACQPCNRNKGSDLGSISERSGELIRFFNPRVDSWEEHLKVSSDGRIEALTEIGEVTVRIFGFNLHERVSERRHLNELGR
mgnify:FL=1